MTFERMLPTVVIVAMLATASVAEESNERVAAVIRGFHAQGQFNGSVLVAQVGKIIYSDAFGTADVDRAVPNELDTRFRIASVTKGFTAVLALQAVERGEFKLDASILEYLPGVTNQALTGVTVEHLLNHTSGIEDFAPTPAEQGQSVRDALVERLNHAELVSSPGEAHKYCNVGYTIMGFALENATGKTYETLLEERVLGPLGMDDSYLEGAPGDGARVRARGYAMNGGQLSADEEKDLSLFPAAGAIVSTAPDLLKFARALGTDQLLNASSRQKLLDESSGKPQYGCQNVKIPTGDRVQIFQGGMAGTSSILIRMNDGQYTVVLLANQSSVPLQAIAREIMMVMLRGG